MSDLILELKNEHLGILAIFDEVSKLGIMTKEGKGRLLASKEYLLQHLEKEDRRLYPVLRERSKTDPTLKRRLDTFAADMAEISAAAMMFFNQYAQGGTGLQFARDLGFVVAKLRDRIYREEEILYPEYDKIPPR